MKVILSNNVLTVKLSDGTFLTTTEGNKELYFKVIQAESEDEIRELMIGTDLTPENVRVIQHNKEVAEIKKAVTTITSDEDFIAKDGNVYMNGVSISLPKVLIEKFSFLASALHYDAKEEYEALKNFWRWAALNPNAQSREDLYGFIKDNGVKLTPRGNMILYRRIIKKGEGNDELLNFVTESYVRVKKGKKNPAKFWVLEGTYEDEENLQELSYTLKFTNDGEQPNISSSENLVGNLKELYLDSENLSGNLYTDAHTKTKNIQIGKVYAISEDEVDLSNAHDCSRGLHCASRRYDYGGFGDQPVMVLVNPSKVRAVPAYNTGKMRVVEMFIAAALEIDSAGKYIDEDVNVIDLDEEYFGLAVEDLKALVAAEGVTEDVGQDVLKIKGLTLNSVNTVLAEFNKVEEALKNRVVKV